MSVTKKNCCALLAAVLACSQFTGCATSRVATPMRLRFDEPLTVDSISSETLTQDEFLHTVSELKSKARRASSVEHTAQAEGICNRADLLVISENKRINKHAFTGFLAGLGTGVALGILNFIRVDSDPNDNEGWNAFGAEFLIGPLIVIGSGAAGLGVGVTSSSHISQLSNGKLRQLIGDHNTMVMGIAPRDQPTEIQALHDERPDTAAIIRAAMELKYASAQIMDAAQRRHFEIGSDSVLTAIRKKPDNMDNETLDAFLGAAVGATLTAGAIALSNHSIRSIGHSRNALAVSIGAAGGGAVNVLRMGDRHETSMLGKQQRRLNGLIEEYNHLLVHPSGGGGER